MFVLAGEILAGKFSNPDGHLECVVDLLEVGSENLRVDGVNVNGNGIDLSLVEITAARIILLSLTVQPPQLLKKLCIHWIPEGPLVHAGEMRL